MATLLAFGLLLLLAVLLSGVAERSVLSIAVLSLIAGFVLGDGGFGVLHVQPETPGLARLIEIAITFSIILHSSTDVLIARWLETEQANAPTIPETQGG